MGLVACAQFTVTVGLCPVTDQVSTELLPDVIVAGVAAKPLMVGAVPVPPVPDGFTVSVTLLVTDPALFDATSA